MDSAKLKTPMASLFPFMNNMAIRKANYLVRLSNPFAQVRIFRIHKITIIKTIDFFQKCRRDYQKRSLNKITFKRFIFLHICHHMPFSSVIYNRNGTNVSWGIPC